MICRLLRVGDNFGALPYGLGILASVVCRQSSVVSGLLCTWFVVIGIGNSASWRYALQTRYRLAAKDCTEVSRRQ